MTSTEPEKTEFHKTENSPWSKLNAAIDRELNKEEYWAKQFPGGEFQYNKMMRCPFPKHEDKNPSFHVKNDQLWKCFGCGKGGIGVLSFEAEIRGVTTMSLEFARQFYSDHIFRLMDDKALAAYHDALMLMEDYTRALSEDFGIKKSILSHYHVGFCKKNNVMTIPLYDHLGLARNMVLYNIRHLEGKEPQWYYRKKVPHRCVWPVDVLNHSVDTVFFLEGYKDCLVALSMGLPAVTLGSATMKLPPEMFDGFRRKKVYFLYDPDDPGRAGSKTNADILIRHKITDFVKIVEIPQSEGHIGKREDFTDWVRKNHLLKGAVEKLCIDSSFYEMQEAAPILSATAIEKEKEETTSPPLIPLTHTVNSEWHEKAFTTEAIIAGKNNVPVRIPNVIRVTCRSYQSKCKKTSCTLAHCGPSHANEFTIDKKNPRIMRFCEQSDVGIQRVCRELFGLCVRCGIACEILKSYTATHVFLTQPTGGSEHLSSPFHTGGYFFSDPTDIRVNSSYLLTGYTTHHPVDSSVIGVYIEGKRLASSVEKYTLTERGRRRLEDFQIATDDLYLFLKERFYKKLGESITPIRGRELMLMGMDLVFHSPMAIVFNGECIPKASLDVLVFGDTGCGKTKAAQALIDHYQHGEILTGENTTLAGLQGGIKMNSGYKGPAWGRLPMNHGGTVVIDEMSGIHPEIIGNLSRIRDWGIAEICKDMTHAMADAVCGILWLSNTREGRPLRKFTWGINALQSLVPKGEDVRRFDYVVAVRDDDVPSEDILQDRSDYHPNGQFYSTEYCHELILFIKSRRPDQIIFTKDATHLILKEALRLGHIYTTDVQLALPAVIHTKIAKVAAAIACRVFAVEKEGENVVVTAQHAIAAVHFLSELFNSRNLGYGCFSEYKKSTETLQTELLETVMHKYVEIAAGGVTIPRFCEFILSSDPITEVHVQNFLVSDKRIAEECCGYLHARCNALKRIHNFYVKTDEFNDWLRARIEKGK